MTIPDLLNLIDLCETSYVAARDSTLLPPGAIPIFGSTLAEWAFDAERMMGFVTADSTIVFRGSMNIADWIDDFSGIPAPSRGIHAGFQTVYQALRPSLMGAINNLSKPITITGHSLGGALAQLAADDLRDLGPVVITFESPRVGPSGWTTVPSIRIANRHDIVPHFPSRPQFAHAGRAIIFDGGGALDPARAHALATCKAAIGAWTAVPAAVEID